MYLQFIKLAQDLFHNLLRSYSTSYSLQFSLHLLDDYGCSLWLHCTWFTRNNLQASMFIILARLEHLSVLNLACYSPRLSSFYCLCCFTNSPSLVNPSTIFYLNYFPSPLYIASMSSESKRKICSARKALLPISPLSNLPPNGLAICHDG